MAKPTATTGDRGDDEEVFSIAEPAWEPVGRVATSAPALTVAATIAPLATTVSPLARAIARAATPATPPSPVTAPAGSVTPPGPAPGPASAGTPEAPALTAPAPVAPASRAAALGRALRARAEAEEAFSEAEDEDPLEDFAQATLRATPWWVVSLAFHGVIAAALPLVWFTLGTIDADSGTRTVIVPVARVLKIDLGDRPRALHEAPEIPGGATPEHTVFFPEAALSDHHESKDDPKDQDLDHPSMLGESLDALSRHSLVEHGLKGRQSGGFGASDSVGIGVGSGGARRFGTRLGGRRDLVARGGGSAATESAVEAGLMWLARTQRKDGSWPAPSPDADDPFLSDDHTVGVTGLACLAFLGRGIMPQARAVAWDRITGQRVVLGESLKRGLAFLIARQDRSGALGPTENRKELYDHVVATYALVEAVGLTNAIVYRGPAQRALDYLLRAQNPGSGWQYKTRSGVSDMSMTGFAVMALKSARLASLEVPERALAGARTFLGVCSNDDGTTGYWNEQVVRIQFQGRANNARWSDHPTTTAVGLMLRVFLEEDREDARRLRAAQWLGRDLPRAAETGTRGNPRDAYYWYAGTLALFQANGPSGEDWRRWNDAIVPAICDSQRRGFTEDGSWDAAADRWGAVGGPVYVTAMNVLTLEVYYRFEAVDVSTLGARTPPKPR